ncbi:unnamed protein product [Kuraishia capsulata CBS 1993]|uniref:Uncharacterized protein n=1 Tax=Kuraishia capsulata CBS 1993 TaxID=1382522 RepID=W6MRK6_9ASCO|nr:uncharacterized protein KUCA_T00000428001 [Kuraishia capsulata CBS 1993]CDK24465.1 unnamed protein product [Kuraishia capsulata CBS 1993]
MEEVDSALVDNAKSFIAGGFGGICAVLTGHPFDLLKVRLQTGLYKSTLECFKDTLKKDGPRGFYRGVLPPLLGVTPMFAVSFWGYDVGRRIVLYTSKQDASVPLSVAQISAAGFLSAVPTTAIAAPFERVKVMLQIQQSKTGMLSMVKQIYKEGGLRSVFKGSLATMARDGPGSALYFATYEVLKERLSTPGKDLSLGAITIAGGFAGVSMWLGVFPIDTIKSRQQSSSVKTSIVQVTRQIHAEAGLKGFFPGIGPALMRSFPANAATFLGVELARNFLSKIV